MDHSYKHKTRFLKASRRRINALGDSQGDFYWLSIKSRKPKCMTFLINSRFGISLKSVVLQCYGYLPICLYIWDCPWTRMYISWSGGWIFPVRSSKSRFVVLQRRGHLPIWPILACSWTTVELIQQTSTHWCKVHWVAKLVHGYIPQVWHWLIEPWTAIWLSKKNQQHIFQLMSSWEFLL